MTLLAALIRSDRLAIATEHQLPRVAELYITHSSELITAAWNLQSYKQF
jgi:hypothetical protein